jgi:hypothetical protein
MPQLSPSGVAVRVRDAHRSDRRAVRAVLLAAYREYATVLPPAVFGPPGRHPRPGQPRPRR